MANRTMKDAESVHSTNPQYLVEKIIRSRIYDSLYWKESCFALTAESIIDRATELKYVGGVTSGLIKPTPFICLVLKLLQIQPDKDIVLEYIASSDFKYLRCLGAFYLRLVGTSIDCYTHLEPLLKDFRKVKRMKRDGGFELIHVDEFVDELLTEERACDIILPRITTRYELEMNDELEPYDTTLLDELGEIGHEDAENDAEASHASASAAGPAAAAAAAAMPPGTPPAPPTEPAAEVSGRGRSPNPRGDERRSSRGRSRSPRSRRRHYGRSPSPRGRYNSRSPPPHRRYRSRSRSRSPPRYRRRSRSNSPRSRRYSPRSPRSPPRSGYVPRSPSPPPPDDASNASAVGGGSDKSSKAKKHRLKFKGDGKKKASNKEPKAQSSGNTEADEIAAANALRAKLGLAPLRP
mmetsp:Transcript_18200/g.47459  ORF Transcript_18200/g.47459 Transcript_18200/m.47459 type:complete len:408 (-) Transcript_18200:342-1565(-)